jgi:hypothetical protein
VLTYRRQTRAPHALQGAPFSQGVISWELASTCAKGLISAVARAPTAEQKSGHGEEVTNERGQPAKIFRAEEKIWLPAQRMSLMN